MLLHRWVFAFLILTLWGPIRSTTTDREEVERFNSTFLQLHRNMDTTGIFALWADDGVDLMPGEAPLVGKKSIVAWVQGILSSMPGHKVVKEELDFHDIQVSGDWASEWATEHQVVQPSGDKPPIDGYGKIALVLHREANGQWKIKQEMWNAAPKPKSPPSAWPGTYGACEPGRES